MDNDYLEIRKQAKEILSEMSIMDGDAFLNNLLFELSETDNKDIKLKAQTLDDIKKLLRLKHRIKIKNDDVYYLKNIAEQLRLEPNRDLMIDTLIKVINNIDEEKYFIAQKNADAYINSLENKDKVIISSVRCEELGKLLEIIKQNF